MAKRKSSRRKRAARPVTPSTAPAPVRPIAEPIPMQAPVAAPPPPAAASATRAPVTAEAAPARPKAGSRFTHRDYAYVRRDVQRILMLALAIIIAIVVISFFLP